MRKLTYALALLLTLAALLLILAPPIHAHSAPAPNPLGVWRGALDGVPGVTLTLADDIGALDGTIVFYGLDGATHKVATMEPHTLIHPKLDGDTLTFQLKMMRTSEHRFITIHVQFIAPTKAQLRCLDCGDAPVTELTKNEF